MAYRPAAIITAVQGDDHVERQITLSIDRETLNITVGRDEPLRMPFHEFKRALGDLDAQARNSS